MTPVCAICYKLFSRINIRIRYFSNHLKPMLRRDFIKLSAVGLASVMYSRLTYAAAPNSSLINYPDEAWAQVDNQWIKLAASDGSVFTYQGIKVSIKTNANAQAVYIQSAAELQAVRLKWKYQTTGYSKILGDHWERSYGDLGWKAP